MNTMLLLLLITSCVKSSPVVEYDKRGYECNDYLPRANCSAIVQNGECAKYELDCMVTCDYCPPDREICNTPGCAEAANRIRSYVDPTVRPCDNFYDFACGGFVRNAEIPAGESKISVRGKLKQEIYEIMKGILLRPVSSDDLPPIANAKKFYKSCVDVDTMIARGDGLFKDWLRDNVLAAPVFTEGWAPGDLDLTDALSKAYLFFTMPLVGFGRTSDDKDSTKQMLQLDEPLLLGGKSSASILAFKETITKSIMSVGPTDPATVAKDVDDVLDFQMRLAQNTLGKMARWDFEGTYNPMTLGEIHQRFSGSGLDLRSFVLTTMSDPDVGVIDITDDEIILVRSPEYLQNLTRILRETSKRTIANHIAVQLLKMWRDYLGPAQQKIIFDFDKALYGQKEQSDPEDQCLKNVFADLMVPLSKPFVDKYFKQSAKKKAEEMIADLKTAFDEELTKTDWMDATTKERAIEKMHAISQKIGHPEYMADDDMFNKKFENNIFDETKYFENAIQLRKEFMASNLRELRKPVNKNGWYRAPAQVMAYYSPWDNEMVITAAMLQSPFFCKDYPRYLNYGAIGTVIGHEITHGFDRAGNRFDKDGNAKKWWSDESTAMFNNRAQCLVDQYGNFTLPEANGMNLDGERTLGENIADNGGIKHSFKAYRNFIRSRGAEEALLPNLPYTQNQLFFISYAQLMCTKMTTEAAEAGVQTQRYAHGRYRVNGPLKNNLRFAETFQCQSGSYMNPPNKCHVW